MAGTGSDFSATANDLLKRLVTGLAGLEPADRRAWISHCHSVIEQATAGGHRTGGGTAARQEPRLPLRVCDWAADEGRSGPVQRLAIDMTPGPTQVAKTRAATGRSLVSNGYLGADLLHLPAGEGFAPHTHPGDHLLFVLGGDGTVTVDGAITPTTAGQVYMIEGAVPHAVGAVTDHVILAVGAPHRPLDSLQRQQLTAYSGLLTPFGSITCQICGVAGGRGEELAEQGCLHSPHVFADHLEP